jgi:hypothetical protein
LLTLLATASTEALATILPMYQLWKGAPTIDWFYTTRLSQRSSAIANSGYTDVGVAFYVESTQVPGSYPWHRLWLDVPYTEHFYTALAADVAYITAAPYYARQEHDEGYVYLSPVPGTVPLYRAFYRDATSNFTHFYTISPTVANYYATLPGWQLDGVVGYVWPSGPPVPQWDAHVYAQAIPTYVEQDVPTWFSVTMRNTGTGTWRAGEWLLSTRNPQDNRYWCLQNTDVGPNRVGLPHDVLPGQEWTFSAPMLPGHCNDFFTNPVLQFGMLSPTYGTWGESTLDVHTVVGVSATFVSEVLPAVMQPGVGQQVQVTFKNTGIATWTPTTFSIGLQPPGNTAWSPAKVYVASTVAPGGQYTFAFNLAAPLAEGTYTPQWRMQRDDAGWLGQITPALPVIVTSAPANRVGIPPGSAPAYTPPWNAPPFNPFVF